MNYLTLSLQGGSNRLDDGKDVFDVVIAGAGPAGSTCAYYLSRLSRTLYAGTGLRIALLDKATFPRDKYCGDAWCAPALDLLEDMEILQELEAEGLVVDCLSGGFVSPAGHSFIANDRDSVSDKKNMATRCYAIKRKICDDRIAQKAGSSAGVSLIEGACVCDTSLDLLKGVWTVTCTNGRIFQARMLVAADGASSNIGRKLGIVKTPPQGIACRRYVKGGTHNFKADGVLLYPEYTLPGYAALFRHYDDSIDLGAYFLPGGNVKEEDVADIYEKKLMTDPFVSRALGPNFEFAERLKVASLRLGGTDKSYGNHVLLVGDACGQVDPLTGEGIHTGMQGGVLAAKTIVEMFRQGNFSEAACKNYEAAWWNEFGKDFPMSDLAGKIVKRLPFLMDAVPIASAKKGGKDGSAFFADFGAVMTGVKPKSTLLLPSVAIPLAAATMIQFVKQYILRTERTYMQDPFLDVEKALLCPTSWESQCIVDSSVQVGKDHSLDNAEDNALLSIFKFSVAPNKEKSVCPVLILYGTEYGYAKELAQRLSKCLHDSQAINNIVFSVRCMSMSYYSLVDWSKERICLFICSTAGDGVPPVQAREFFEFLGSGNKCLKDTYCAVLALGDVSYPKFCEAGKTLAKILKENSAALLQDVSDIASGRETNGMASEELFCYTLDGDNTCEADKWIKRVVDTLHMIVGSPSMQLEHWLHEVNLAVDPNNQSNDYLRQSALDNLSLFTKQKKATRESPCLTQIKRKRELTNRQFDAEKDDPKEVWEIVLDVSHSDMLDYTPGDAIGILPENDPEEVSEILLKLGLSGTEEISESLTASDYLLKICDIKEKTDSLIQYLSKMNIDASEIGEFMHFVDLVSKYQSELISLKVSDRLELLRTLGKIKPRFYSVASSPAANENEIHLCVAAVRYKALNRSRKGLASCFLIDRCPVGRSVSAFIQLNPDFRPTLDKKPKIMFGPGTGVAPFISYIRDKDKSHSVKDMLFFGSRHEKADFLFGEELLAWDSLKNCTLITAFSRDQPEKVYVQHKLREADTALKTWEIIQNKGNIYICGDGWSMATVSNIFLLFHTSNRLTL